MFPSPTILPPPPTLPRSIHLSAVLACPGIRAPELPREFPAASRETVLLDVDHGTWFRRSAGPARCAAQCR